MDGQDYSQITWGEPHTPWTLTRSEDQSCLVLSQDLNPSLHRSHIPVQRQHKKMLESCWKPLPLQNHHCIQPETDSKSEMQHNYCWNWPRWMYIPWGHCLYVLVLISMIKSIVSDIINVHTRWLKLATTNTFACIISEKQAHCIFTPTMTSTKRILECWLRLHEGYGINNKTVCNAARCCYGILEDSMNRVINNCADFGGSIHIVGSPWNFLGGKIIWSGRLISWIWGSGDGVEGWIHVWCILVWWRRWHNWACDWDRGQSCTVQYLLHFFKCFKLRTGKTHWELDRRKNGGQILALNSNNCLYMWQLDVHQWLANGHRCTRTLRNPLISGSCSSLNGHLHSKFTSHNMAEGFSKALCIKVSISLMI